MAINEITKTGRVFRKLIDKENMRWLKLSFWTKASDVEFDDGKTAEKKIGAINGITSNIDDDGDDICASISVVKKTVNQLKKSFQDGYKKIIDALIAIGAITSEEAEGLSPEDISNLIKNNTGDYKYHAIAQADGSLTYVCPKSGYYNIYADYVAGHNNAHKATLNNVTLQIGSTTYTLYKHFFDYNTSVNSWTTTGIGRFNKKIYCNANTVIKLNVTGFNINNYDEVSERNPQIKVYTIGTLVIT